MGTTIFGQQTPKEMALQMKKYEEQLNRYDNGFDSVYSAIDRHIKTDKNVANVSVWHSCMAQLLQEYYRQNRWKILDRTPIEGAIPEDFNVWDIQTLVSQTIYHYQQSLQNEQLLKSIPIRDYAAILDSVKSEKYRPTLYDFLAFRFLDFLDDDIDGMPVPSTPFDINNPKYWTSNDVFTNLVIQSPDNSSFSYLTLKTMQTLTQLHLNDADAHALLDVTLRRYDYLSSHTTLENATQLTLDELMQLEQHYQGKEGYEMVTFHIGDYYQERAEEYDENAHPEYQMDYATAIGWYNKTIDAAPKSIEAHNAKCNRTEIQENAIRIVLNTAIPVNKPFLVNLQYTNCEKINLRILSTTLDEYEQLCRSHSDYAQLIQKKYVYDTSIILPKDSDYREKSGHFMAPALKRGYYIVMASNGEFKSNNKEKFCYTLLTVSEFNAECRTNDGKYEVFVFDRVSGNPLAGAEVLFECFESSSKEKRLHAEKKTTDRDGRCVFKYNPPQGGYKEVVTVQWNNDKRVILSKYNWHSNYHYSDTARTKTCYIFTDRSIYRPGQTVYYKGIVAEHIGTMSKTIDNEACLEFPITISLEDANQQTVETATRTTNEYGSFSGSFVLPISGLTGSFRLNTKHGSHSFRVEEYKRPTFEVTMEQPQEEFKLEQTVNVSGNVKAFAGYGIDGATVKYNVIRTASFPWWRWWWWTPSSKTQQIANGEVSTDADGNFHLDFVALPDLESQRYNPLYDYAITVDVTDITGETHSASLHVFISKIGLTIQCGIPAQLATTAANSFDLTLLNRADKPQEGTIHYEIHALTMPAEYKYYCPKHNYYLSDSAAMHKALPYLAFEQDDKMQNWPVQKRIAQGDFVTTGKEKFSIPNLENFKEGAYKIILTTLDKDHNEITDEHFFTVDNPTSKKCVVYQPLWITSEPQGQVSFGKEVHFTVGTYLKKVKVLCEIIVNDQLVESRWVDLDQGKTTFSYKANTYGQIICHCFVAQNNNSYNQKLRVNVPHDELNIDFDFLSFRDKTTPGSSEEYIIRLKDKKGDKVAAEMLCSMYDASLDALASPNKIGDKLCSWYYGNYNYNMDSYGLRANFLSYSGYQLIRNAHNYSKTREYPSLTFISGGIYGRRYGRGPVLYCANAAPNTKGYVVSEEIFEDEDVAFDGVQQEEVILNVVEDNIKVSSDMDFETGRVAMWEPPAEEPTAQDVPAVRTNFAETAFFYPHLKTDENGNVLVSFTMPESLTQWKLQGFAHNPYLMTGWFEKTVQTSKKLMAVPNAPRFLREGDTLIFSAKVVNMDSVTQCGNVTLTFRDALNGEPVQVIDGHDKQPFEVKPGSSQEVHFNVVVPRDLSALTYRVVATNLETPAFSDGEEATLPVLTNRILVTEAMQLHISGKGHKAFTFDRLKNNFAINSPTLSTQSLTLEFTPNPIWYAIQAMPYLMEYPYECNEQIFSRYYANALAANIMNTHPRVKEVFNEWLNETPDAFCSQLEKNQELKSILLEETPWVMDAQNEATRKQNIALLFDLQRMAKEGKTACKKLEDRQNSDGGWSWFAGGQSSPYITEHILAGFGHLNTLHVPTDIKDATLKKSISYIDREMNDYYQKWIKKDKKCGWGNIHYLYARSYFLNKKVPANCQEAYNYYYNNLKADWKSQSIYMQGMIALICYRNGDTKIAQSIIAHIKSIAQYDEEMGMFWKKNGYGYFWYEAPIERQALLIEAFNTITKDEESVEKMQLWLLKQKQTQSWPTTKSTTESIYALLLNNDQLDNAGGVKLSLGDWTYTEGDGTEQAEAGSGYIKKCWRGADVKDNMATINIDKQTSGPAWGGLYWQYLENLDKVEHSQDKELSILKKLYKVTIGDRGEQLTEITEETPLKVGDKVRVRVEIRTDRDMEYVHLKDMRASCFEPSNVLSGYKHQDGLWYYESTRDAATNFFIDYLPKGTYVFEYTLTATMAGTCSNGLTTIQCMYAPEFTSHSEGQRVKVE